MSKYVPFIYNISIILAYILSQLYSHMKKLLLALAALIVTAIPYSSSFAKETPITICAKINNAYWLSPDELWGMLTIDVTLQASQYSVSGSCVTIYDNTNIPLGIDIRYDQPYAWWKWLLEHRSDRFFQDNYVNTEIMLSYDIYVIEGWQDSTLKWSLHHQYNVWVDWHWYTTMPFGGFDNSIVWYSVSQLYKLWATKYNTTLWFMPGWYLTREQSTKFFSVIADRISGGIWYTQQQVKDAWCVFKDANTIDSSLKSYIENVCVRGIMKWSKWYFNPKWILTLWQVAAVLYRLREGRLDESGNPRHVGYIKWWYKYDFFDQVWYNPNPYTEWDYKMSRWMFASILFSIINSWFYHDEFKDIIELTGTQ